MQHCSAFNERVKIMDNAVICQQVSQGSRETPVRRELHTTSTTFASGDVALDLEHATGLERCRINALLLLCHSFSLQSSFQGHTDGALNHST
jgi:hypothetical protein